MRGLVDNSVGVQVHVVKRGEQLGIALDALVDEGIPFAELRAHRRRRRVGWLDRSNEKKELPSDKTWGHCGEPCESVSETPRPSPAEEGDDLPHAVVVCEKMTSSSSSSSSTGAARSRSVDIVPRRRRSS